MSRTADVGYRRRRARVLAPRRIWCHICEKEIDKTLAWPHPMSPTADHLDPVAAGGSNTGPLAPAHKHCNESRGKLTLRAYDERQARRAAQTQAAAQAEPQRPAFRW